QTRSELILSAVCAGIVAINACVVMAGWWTENRLLVQIHSDFAPMRFNTALCVLLCSISILIMLVHATRIAAIPALLAAGFSWLTILQYKTGLDFGIDTVFMVPFIEEPFVDFPGRMALNSALGVTICGAVLAFCAFSRRPGAIRAIAIALAGSVIG